MKSLDESNLREFVFGENLDRSLLAAHSADKPGHANSLLQSVIALAHGTIPFFRV